MMSVKKTTLSIAVIVGISITAPAHAADQWLQYARDHLNNPVVDGWAAPEPAQLRWVVSPGDYELCPSSSPVAFQGKVYVYGYIYDYDFSDGTDDSLSCVAAYSASDGSLVWKTDIDFGAQDSWSSPAVDPVTLTVLIGSGQKVFGLDAVTGAIKWATDLGNDIFNASVTVADGRAFITDSTAVTTDAYGDPGTAFALNLGATSDDEGDILWSVPIGVTSGCTAAYYDEAPGGNSFVIFADADGWLRALDPATGIPQWSYQVPDADGWKWTPGGTFWGGVSVADGFVYASTYGFYGGQDNSFTYKLNADTGELVWRAPSERTNSVPVVYGDLVLVCGGTHFYGVPKLEALDINTGTKLWEFTAAGARTHTPAVVNGICYVGTMPDIGDYYYQTLYAVDLSLTPDDPGFVLGLHHGAGGTPAYHNGGIYSVGADGLHAFRTWMLEGDVTFDCKVNILDMIFVRNKLNTDPASGDNWKAEVTGDGKINVLDMILIRNRLNTNCSQ